LDWFQGGAKLPFYVSATEDASAHADNRLIQFRNRLIAGKLTDTADLGHLSHLSPEDLELVLAFANVLSVSMY